MSNYESKFLGNKGLTSSEANYTANIIKEMCERIKADIGKLTVFSSKIHFNGKESTYNEVYKVDNLEQKCLEEGELYALSSWLREAIKAKEQLMSVVQSDCFGIELHKQLPSPNLDRLKTEKDILWDLPIDELAEFLSVESKASHVGQKVHPHGIFDDWFKQIKNVPRIQIHKENKDYVIELTQEYQEKDLYEIYFKLQAEYREYEQRVNYYKAKIKNILTEENVAINNSNSLKSKEYGEAVNEISLKNSTLTREIENKRLEKMKEISNLKIIIPNSMQSILDEVQKVGKKQ